MFESGLRAAAALAVSALAITSAEATTFNFTITSPSGDASGQFTATGGPGQFTVTGVTGTVDGSAITGLSSYGFSDQQLYEPVPYVDNYGVAFSAADGNDYNIYYYNGYNFCSSAYNDCQDVSDGSPAQFTLTAVPEPANWALMLVGFGGLGVAMRSRRRLVAANV